MARHSDQLVTRLRDINKRIKELESEIASLREQLADFRDAVLHERGALAEGGMTGDQINAVLSEFDDRFVPYDQERAE
jgi:chromosome segregation ATPase